MYPQAQKAVNNFPATATQATIASEAPASNAWIIVTGLIVSVAGAAAATSGILQWVLRDGATGVGTVKLTGALQAPLADTADFAIEDLELPMTPGNVATLEFTAAGAAGSQEAVSLLYKVSNQLNG